MEKNIGTQDRAVRFFIATICGVSAFSREAGTDWFFWLLVIAGGYVLLTAFAGTCALYSILHWSTRDRKPPAGTRHL